MKILTISDIESDRYYNYYRPGKFDGIDLILSAGDL
ncbi:MAG TPA: metallophosphoesterase, partial [Erysipelotrichaceae bacterium]|nr:metallophosphoesterase [Erysipelotrichaceae bacterium]